MLTGREAVLFLQPFCKINSREFPTGSISAWETEIPHAKQHGQNKKNPQNINWKYKAKKNFFQKEI